MTKQSSIIVEPQDAKVGEMYKLVTSISFHYGMIVEQDENKQQLYFYTFQRKTTTKLFYRYFINDERVKGAWRLEKI